MKSQRSTEDNGGKLYLVGTPIGNLEDMTYRAIRMLKESDYIAAEDTRNTVKLCNHFEIQTPLMSYHEHNLEQGGEKILKRLAEGKTISLVSDAGMPCISDPGIDIAQKALKEGYDVIPVPGANAAISALVASGLPSQPFLFYGFLSRRKKVRREEIDLLKVKRETIIFYEAPHRLKDTLLALAEQLDGNRKIVLARELTKRYEEFLRGTLEEAVDWVKSTQLRGEFCIVLEGALGAEEGKEPTEKKWWGDLTVVQHVNELIEQKKIRSKEAIKEVAVERNMNRREVYRLFHVKQE